MAPTAFWAQEGDTDGCTDASMLDQPHDRAFGVMHLVDGQPEFFNAEREIDMLMSAAACDEWEESDDELPKLRDVLWGASGIDDSDEEES
ncbi:hypothetical protein AAF712_014696 [Marasmius tenuissimus]|uniref:Uncharacterized protein n=1 Tax=Marasmius tenuissimus TaxID=585030 RepID=A0ABR2ZBH9_9AGAR